MAHLDGVNYGYDIISSAPNHNLTYDRYSWDGWTDQSARTTILEPRNRKPPKRLVTYPEVLPLEPHNMISNRFIKKDIPEVVEDQVDTAVEKPVTTEKTEKYTVGKPKSSLFQVDLDHDDILMFMILLFVFVLLIQLQMNSKIDTLIKLQLQQRGEVVTV